MPTTWCPYCKEDVEPEMEYAGLDASDLAAHFQTMNDIDRQEFFALLARSLTTQDRAQLLSALLKA